MKKPQLPEVNWKSIKLLENGAGGMAINYAFLYDVKGHTQCLTLNTKNDLPPHESLIQLIDSLCPIVAKVENIDYGRKLINTPDFEPTKLQEQLMEATVENAIEKLNIVGIVLRKKKEIEGVEIVYTKEDEYMNITEHQTAWINPQGNENGIEEELAAVVNQIKSKTYGYLYLGEHADFEQLTIEMETDNEPGAGEVGENQQITDVEVEEQ
jgi:hypothetical protein